jgi:hypothetical protein
MAKIKLQPSFMVKINVFLLYASPDFHALPISIAEELIPFNVFQDSSVSFIYLYSIAYM